MRLAKLAYEQLSDAQKVVWDEVVAGPRKKMHGPFFLWLHFYDPHFPYRPPAAAGARAGGNDYLGEVSAMDEAIGRVLDALERSGELEHTLVAALADHGEGLGRHGEETHGAFVFDSTLRIPFLLRLPGAARAGERRADPVSQVDLAPTLAVALDWPLDTDFDGRDLLGTSASPGVYFESYFGVQSFGWSQVAGWTDGRAKYVHSSAPELYELARDPHDPSQGARLHADVLFAHHRDIVQRGERVPLEDQERSGQRHH